MNKSTPGIAANLYPWIPLADSACALSLLQEYVVEMALASWAYLLASSVLVLLLYYLLQPFNWCRDLSEVGYSFLMDGGVSEAQRRGKSKREVVREVRHLRKVGSLPPVYPNGWFVLLESSDLQPGQVKHVPALGENFAVFRTSKGEVHVLDAYCPHLGANMGVGGLVRGDCLQCPFHGWVFSGVDGKCKSIPYSDKVPSFAHVKKWNSTEVNSFIFVWYHAENEEPTWWPKPIPEIEEKKWVFRGRNEFIINSHIQEVPENGGDVAHLSSVHGPCILNGSDLRYIHLLWRFTHHEWDAKWDPNEEPGNTHTATMHLKHEIRFFNKIGIISMDVRAQQIGPAYVELNFTSSMGNMIFLQCITPLEPMLQKVIHRLYCPRHMYLYATIAMWGESVMFERDVMVWNHKTYIERPLLVKEDRNIARHRRWYSQFYSEHSPRFQFHQETLDW